MRALGWIVVAEIVAFIAGLVLWYNAGWPWWTCLLSLLVPPIILIVLFGVMLIQIVRSSEEGRNPFQ